MDETGIMEGMIVSQTVFAEAGAKKVYVKKQKRNKWTIIIECVSAEGNYLSPVIILAGENLSSNNGSRKKLFSWRIGPLLY